MLEAVIFDMDGVIVDTEYIEFNFLKDFVHHLNDGVIRVTDDEMAILAGKSYNDLYNSINQLTDNKYDIAYIEKEYASYISEKLADLDYLSIFRNDIKKTLNFCLENKIKLAVASSSQKNHIENILTHCGIKEIFNLIVSGEQFPSSKPDPTIYNYTVENLGVQTDRVIVIEDSPPGILSAKRANLKVIAYKETRILIDQSLADYSAENMAEVYEIIKKIHFEK